MYLSIDFDRVRAHEEYLEEQKAVINSIIDDVDMMRRISQDGMFAADCGYVLEKLELLRQSINFRQDILEKTVEEFKNVMSKQDEKISEMDLLLRNMDIFDQ